MEGDDKDEDEEWTVIVPGQSSVGSSGPQTKKAKTGQDAPTSKATHSAADPPCTGTSKAKAPTKAIKDTVINAPPSTTPVTKPTGASKAKPTAKKTTGKTPPSTAPIAQSSKVPAGTTNPSAPTASAAAPVAGLSKAPAKANKDKTTAVTAATDAVSKPRARPRMRQPPSEANETDTLPATTRVAKQELVDGVDSERYVLNLLYYQSNLRVILSLGLCGAVASARLIERCKALKAFASVLFSPSFVLSALHSIHSAILFIFYSLVCSSHDRRCRRYASKLRTLLTLPSDLTHQRFGFVISFYSFFLFFLFFRTNHYLPPDFTHVSFGSS
jgi:hypothetical protein